MLDSQLTEIFWSFFILLEDAIEIHTLLVLISIIKLYLIKSGKQCYEMFPLDKN